MLSTAQPSLPAFERVYRGQFDFVLRTLRALGVPESGLDDAVQDVFIVVHRRLPEFEGRASIKTWAYEIARRVALRYRTRAARHAARHAELPPLLSARDDLEDAVERARASDVLQSFLADLDEDRRRAFVLAELWEMSGREIAESLGINMNTVYARIRSARTELDRIAHRMQVRNAGALTRAVRDRRPPDGSRDRARAGVLLAVGGGASSGTAGVVGLVWAGIGAAACALGAVAVVSFSSGEVPSPENSPPPTSTAMPATKPVVTFAPVAVADASVSPQPATLRPSSPMPARPKSKLADPPAPSLSEELAAVQDIRAAVRAGDAAVARAKISAYRKDVPGGALTAEVDALRTELACRTGDPQATALLRAFAEQHRGSTLIDRLTVLCSSKIGPQKPRPPGTQSP